MERERVWNCGEQTDMETDEYRMKQLIYALIIFHIP